MFRLRSFRTVGLPVGLYSASTIVSPAQATLTALVTFDRTNGSVRCAGLVRPVRTGPIAGGPLAK
jgi:hypothetical protein